MLITISRSGVYVLVKGETVEAPVNEAFDLDAKQAEKLIKRGIAAKGKPKTELEDKQGEKVKSLTEANKALKAELVTVGEEVIALKNESSLLFEQLKKEGKDTVEALAKEITKLKDELELSSGLVKEADDATKALDKEITTLKAKITKIETP